MPDMALDSPPRSSRQRPWMAYGFAVLLAVIVGLVSVVIILANRSPAAPATHATATTAPASASATPPAHVGQTVKWNDAAGDSGTIAITAASRHQPRTQYDEHPASGSWLVVDVTVHVDQGSAEVDQYVFRASTPAGAEQTGTSAPLDDMMSMTVPAGRSISGQVGFDVPPGSTLVDWLDPVTGAPRATFNVDA